MSGKNISMLILVLAYLFVTTNLHSTYVQNRTVWLEQPDGTRYKALASGSSYGGGRYHDENNYTIVKEDSTGIYCWGKQDSDGWLKSTGFPVHLYDPKNLDIEPFESDSPERNEEMRAKQFKNIEKIYLPPPERSDIRGWRKNAPTTGNIDQIVIFVKFAEKVEEWTTPISHVESMFNDFAPEDNSLKRYYFDTSYEKLTINSHFFFRDTASSTVTSYQLTMNRNRYIPRNDSLNQVGYIYEEDWTIEDSHEDGRRKRELEILRAACDSVSTKRQAELDILNVDNDDSDYVDNITIVIQDTYDKWGALLWPHFSHLYDSDNLFINNKKVYGYNFIFEEDITKRDVGLLAHEFGHSLMFPDLYLPNDIGEDTIKPVGEWDLMSIQTNPPQTISAYLKYSYTEWIGYYNYGDIPDITFDITKRYTIKPLINYAIGDTIALKFQSPDMDPNEFIIIENREKPPFPSNDGLIIYRIRTDKYSNFESSTNLKTVPFIPFEVYIYRPDGCFNDSTDVLQPGNISQAAFPVNGQNKFSDYSNPSSFLSNGKPSGFYIFSINFFRSNDGSITFEVRTVPEMTFPENPEEIHWTFPYDLSVDLQEAIYQVEHEGTVYFDYVYFIFYEPWWGWEELPWYNIQRVDTPTTLIAKALTFEGKRKPYYDPHYLDFYADFYIRDVYGAVTLKDIIFTTQSLNIDRSNLILDNGYIYLWEGSSTFAGTPDSLNTITFASDSGIYVLNDSSLEITNYSFSDQSKIVAIPPATLTIDGVAYRSGIDEEDIPEVLVFNARNYPNPFNPETTIAFTIPKDTVVKIDIFNVKGQKVKSLLHDKYLKGTHTIVWNSTNDDNRTVGSGVYFYRVQTNENSAVKKMLLLK